MLMFTNLIRIAHRLKFDIVEKNENSYSLLLCLLFVCRKNLTDILNYDTVGEMNVQMIHFKKGTCGLY